MKTKMIMLFLAFLPFCHVVVAPPRERHPVLLVVVVLPVLLEQAPLLEALAEVKRRPPHDLDAVVAVGDLVADAALVQLVHDVAALEGHERVHGLKQLPQRVLYGEHEVKHAVAGLGARHDRERPVVLEVEEGAEVLLAHAVHLVQERDDGLGLALAVLRVGVAQVHDVQVLERAHDARGLLLPVGVAGVDAVHDHVGLLHLLERRAEGRHELRGQLLDEAHGVGEEHVRVHLQRGQAHAARRGVQRREEHVLLEDVGLCQGVEHRALAGVGVAHQRDDGDALLAAPLALGLAVPPHGLDLLLEPVDLVAQEAAVHLDLPLAGAAQAHAAGLAAAAGLALEVRPEPREPRQAVAREGELHLQDALLGAGVLAEDVQDERRAVQHLDARLLAAEGRLEVALLPRAQLLVQDHGLAPQRLHGRAHLAHLAGPDVGPRVRLLQRLALRAHDIEPRGARQLRELAHGREQAEALRQRQLAAALQLHAHEEGGLALLALRHALLLLAPLRLGLGAGHGAVFARHVVLLQLAQQRLPRRPRRRHHHLLALLVLIALVVVVVVVLPVVVELLIKEHVAALRLRHHVHGLIRRLRRRPRRRRRRRRPRIAHW
mmetsp:Transcript_26705/g.83651  ORF Transcript_26705/g.83651 Transcript_26705/m.83651 type:complete len:604 (-) Transcript_26705:37-1848(-)